jgi:hypothetical protein
MGCQSFKAEDGSLPSRDLMFLNFFMVPTHRIWTALSLGLNPLAKGDPLRNSGIMRRDFFGWSERRSMASSAVPKAGDALD